MLLGKNIPLRISCLYRLVSVESYQFLCYHYYSLFKLVNNKLFKPKIGCHFTLSYGRTSLACEGNANLSSGFDECYFK